MSKLVFGLTALSLELEYFGLDGVLGFELDVLGLDEFELGFELDPELYFEPPELLGLDGLELDLELLELGFEDDPDELGLLVAVPHSNAKQIRQLIIFFIFIYSLNVDAKNTIMAVPNPRILSVIVSTDHSAKPTQTPIIQPNVINPLIIFI